MIGTLKNNFKVGDRVRVKKNGFYNLLHLAGKKGIITCISDKDIGIEFDSPFEEGHSCSGYNKTKDRGRWGYEHDLELIIEDWDE